VQMVFTWKHATVRAVRPDQLREANSVYALTLHASLRLSVSFHSSVTPSCLSAYDQYRIVSVTINEQLTSNVSAWVSFFSSASARVHLRSVTLLTSSAPRAPSPFLTAALSLPHLKSFNIMFATSEEMIAISKSALRELTISPSRVWNAAQYESIAPLFASTLCTTLTRFSSTARCFTKQVPPLRNCTQLESIELDIFGCEIDATARARCLAEMVLLPRLASVRLASYILDEELQELESFVTKLTDECPQLTSVQVNFHCLTRPTIEAHVKAVRAHIAAAAERGRIIQYKLI
jgi:hypothetical protein